MEKVRPVTHGSGAPTPCDMLGKPTGTNLDAGFRAGFAKVVLHALADCSMPGDLICTERQLRPMSEHDRQEA